jgi:hypothetical protein
VVCGDVAVNTQPFEEAPVVDQPLPQPLQGAFYFSMYNQCVHVKDAAMSPPSELGQCILSGAEMISLEYIPQNEAVCAMSVACPVGQHRTSGSVTAWQEVLVSVVEVLVAHARSCSVHKYLESADPAVHTVWLMLILNL